MQCVDVNVLVYALRHDLDQHDAYRRVLEELANGLEPLGVPDLVLSGFLRVVDEPEDLRRTVVEPGGVGLRRAAAARHRP